jgi:hypothetical protein
MRFAKLVQLVSVTTIVGVSTWGGQAAAQSEMQWCQICTHGEVVCPSESAQAGMCSLAGCSSGLPGCAENFGNCNPGFTISCNEAT